MQLLATEAAALKVQMKANESQADTAWTKEKGRRGGHETRHFSLYLEGLRVDRPALERKSSLREVAVGQQRWAARGPPLYGLFRIGASRCGNSGGVTHRRGEP